MESSVPAAEVLAPPQPAVTSSSSSSPDGSAEGQAASRPPAPGPSDRMEELSRRLDNILSTYGSAATLLDKQTSVETEAEKMEEEAVDDITVTKETDVSVIMQKLNTFSSPADKLEALVKMYAELAALRRCDEKKLCALQQRLSGLVREKQQLQAEQRRGVAARGELEALCRELHTHNNTLKEETLQRCREDEEKRSEITSHFERTLTDIQTQIEQHSNRNTKLCQENANLADKLESLMNQYELKEQSLEKINRHRDLQQKLAEAKLQEANALLAQAEEKHKREKEYLLREAIDKTKKCFALREQELDMKKKAAEWKLQAQELREQGTVMQAQLSLYSQKFDEFQATLAKSNDIYASFKLEMDKMTKKLKKLEKESNMWKTRFESCNKALANMIEERAEKGKEFELFVLKIQKLEKLCRTLQDERKSLYDKIKEVRHANSMVSSKAIANAKTPSEDESPVPEAPPLLDAVELEEMQEEEDPVLTEDMARLRVEQARLQEFAASLMAPISDTDDDDDNVEEDSVTMAYTQFKTQNQAEKKEPSKPISTPEQVEAKQAVEPVSAKPVIPEPVSEKVKVEEVQAPAGSTSATPAAVTHEEKSELPSEPIPAPEQKQVEANQAADLKPEEVKGKVEVSEVQQPKPEAPVQEKRTEPSEPAPTPGPKKANQPTTDSKPETDLKPEEAKGKVQVEVSEVQQPKPEAPEQEKRTEPSEPAPTPDPKKVEVNLPTTDSKPDAQEGKIQAEVAEVQQPKAVAPEQDDKTQQQPSEAPEAAPTGSAKSSKGSAKPKTAPPPSNSDTSKKQASKKKKKNGKKSS